MKKIYLFIIASALLAGGLYATRFLSKDAPDIKSEETQAPPYNVNERHEWEQRRFQDPATGRIPKNIRTMESAFARTIPGSKYRLVSKNDKALAADWSLRGPYNIGGRTRALGVDILNEDHIIAGGVSGGIWKTANGGNEWVKKTPPDRLHSVSCLTQDTRVGKENIWYYGTGEFWGNSADISGDGIYKSTDSGESWSLLESTSTKNPQSWENPFDYIWRIIINHKRLDRDEIYAAVCLGGIYRSIDGGENWEPVLGGYGNSYGYFTDIAISPNGVMYATISQMSPSGSAMKKGMFRSTDGETWTDITPEDMPERYKRIIVAISPSDENQAYFIAETPEDGKLTFNSRGDELWHSFWKYTYISGDGSGDGGNWENRSDNIPDHELTRKSFNSQGSYDLVMKVKPDDPNVVIFGGTNLYRSTDGLASAENTTMIGGYCPYDDPEPCLYAYRYPNHHADEHEILFSRENSDIMFTGTDGGVHKTMDILADEVEWISLNNGYFTTQFYSCAVDLFAETDEIIGGLQDNGTLFTKWTDKNKPWAYPTFSDGFTTDIANNGEYYFSSQNSSNQPKIKMWRFKLNENGERDYITRIDPIGGKDFIWNNPYKLDPNNSNVMYCAGGITMWRNNDLSLIPDVESKDSVSEGWNNLTLPGVELDEANNERVSALEVSVKPENVVYFGTTRGQLFRLDNSNEGDPVPVDITAKSFPKANIESISCDPRDAAKALVVFSGYRILSIFYTSDSGENWTPVSGNLEEFESGGGNGPAVLCVDVLPIGDLTRYFVGTSIGLFSTSFIDGTNTVWTQDSPDEIGNCVINMIDSRVSDGYIAVATHGLGMFSAHIDEVYSSDIAAPTLEFPENNKGGVKKETELSWKPVPNAGLYKLEIAEDPDFENIFYEKDGIRGESHEVNGFEQGLAKYYWRVTARSSGGISQPSETWSFLTALEPPELLSPEKGADSVSVNPVLKWEELELAASYGVQVSSTIAFSPLLIDTVVSEPQLEINGLDPNQKYYWKVSAGTEDGLGEFSKYFNFKTENIVSVKDTKIAKTEVKCYPNPFEDYTEISFMNNIQGQVNITVYDLSGRIVETLAQGVKPAGEVKALFKPEGLPSGTYLFRISSPYGVFSGMMNYKK